ncbi:BCCT family transporter [Pelagimonas varians]|uniref:Glycine betaine transporter OpuD n=1 Tax=Pelagimonas varians TaxID=696760 RepID=A0A238L461_9RHOB|nr:BCCT family transporter [Pelagimonas varians]PYG25467.1 glycine betaine transporter [Pelagimonas varians]SMX49854.1 Glycine betaine transporter OpuD [Pelagimonas varians]
MGSTSILPASLVVISAVGLWGIVDPEGALRISSAIVDRTFASRGWFVMLTATGLLFICLWLAASRFGKVRLGHDDDRPEFSTASWLAMLFSAGMGVGLLFWAAAEPLTHFKFARQGLPDPQAASAALLATNFNWGLHAWGIYCSTALVIAYFSFRQNTPMLVSAPLVRMFGAERWARVVGWLSDFLAIAAIAIGVGGSVAMGVFQVADGVNALLGRTSGSQTIVWISFAAIVLCYMPPLMVDLGSGMARLSSAALLIAIGLLLYTVVLGPTEFLLNSVVTSFGDYIWNVVPSGFRTFTFFDDVAARWFKDWTLTYMVWWIAWGPFVGVFVARISRGRTIREFVLGVVFVPTVFSIFWFGAFGGIGLFDSLRNDGALLEITGSNVERVTFAILERLPFATLTTLATIAAAFLFIVTSVVSAAFVLGAFSTGGDPDPSPRVRLIWGAVLAVLSFTMVLSGSVAAVKSLIALGALPFVFILVLLMVCFLRALFEWEDDNADR